MEEERQQTSDGGGMPGECQPKTGQLWWGSRVKWAWVGGAFNCPRPGKSGRISRKILF